MTASMTSRARRRTLLALGALPLVPYVRAGVPAAPLPVPAIMSAAAWGSVPPDPARMKRHTITHITLHHQGETFKPGTDMPTYLRHLQAWSRSARPWQDIPYHYIVGPDGALYEGRAIEYAGETNTEYDPTGHALIEVVGNFEEIEPTQAQLDAVITLMAWLAQRFQVPLHRIASHRDVSAQTVCPGRNLYRYIQNGYLVNQVRQRLNFSSQRRE
jgi:hypothetical protein